MDPKVGAMRRERRKRRKRHVVRRRAPPPKAAWSRLCFELMRQWHTNMRSSTFSLNLDSAIAESLDEFGPSPISHADFRALKELPLSEMERKLPRMRMSAVLEMMLGWVSEGRVNALTQALDIMARASGSSPGECNAAFRTMFFSLYGVARAFGTHEELPAYVMTIANILIRVPMLNADFASLRVMRDVVVGHPAPCSHEMWRRWRLASTFEEGGIRPIHVRRPSFVRWNPTRHKRKPVELGPVDPLRRMTTLLALCQDAGRRAKVTGLYRTPGVVAYVTRATRAVGTWTNGQWPIERLMRYPGLLVLRSREIRAAVGPTIVVQSNDHRFLEMTLQEVQDTIRGVNNLLQRRMIVVALVSNHMLSVKVGARALEILGSVV